MHIEYNQLVSIDFLGMECQNGPLSPPLEIRVTPVLDSSGHYADTTIELRTRAGNPIDNVQVWKHSAFEWHLLGDLLKRFADAKRVSDACPVYNCHGLTFGSRRTQISDSIYPILDDDGFDTVPEKEARPGDIIVYCSSLGEAVHSGFIVSEKVIELAPGRKTVVPLVWSKWGKSCEMIHPVAQCPYLDDAGNHVRYYRLKRWSPLSAKPQHSVLTL